MVEPTTVVHEQQQPGQLRAGAQWPGQGATGTGVATTAAPHVRDAMNLSRAMVYTIIALIPCILVAIYNTGYQANVLLAEAGMEVDVGWHGAVIDLVGLGYGTESILASIGHGLLISLPVFVTALITGSLWEALFVSMRGGGHQGDYILVALLFALSLPPAVPLWQVAIGMSFGLVVGKEIFGGTGKHFLNPTLTGLAFLYLTYPAQMVGETAWAVHGLSGATPLQDAGNGTQTIAWTGTTWMQSFLGLVPGAIGGTSTLASMVGAAVLLSLRLVSGRVIAGVMIGVIAAASLFNLFGDETNAYAAMSWHWHLVLGSFAFATVFLATDPVSAPMTDAGRWIYGLLVGGIVVLIRVLNTTHPDGILFAILLGNILAPLIDYAVMSANIRRRIRRNG